jgi:phospholipid/cholesterol/gamma-HCH transport system ATP-binding protein
VVSVQGRPLATLTEDELNEVRRSMSAVLQGSLPFSCGLFFSLNVFENVAFPLRDRTRLPEERIEEITMEHLGMVGLADRATSMPAHLSSGMCKRAALARALALDARILIIDDFDSGIDGVRLGLLCDLLKEIQEESGATFLLSTHDMGAARRLADHVAVIHEGRIVASGPAGDIFSSSDPLVSQLLEGGIEGPIGFSDDRAVIGLTGR